MDLPPRATRAHPGLQRRRPATAAGLDLVGGPGAPRRAVVPRGGAAAAPRHPEGDGRRPEGCAHHRGHVRGARRPRARLPAADDHPRGLLRPAHGHREGRRTHALPARARGLRSAAGRAPDPAHRHARPRRDRGERAADLVVGRPATPHRDAVRTGPPKPPRDGEVRPRRTAHRHRRRQPHHARRVAAGRFAAAAPPRPAREPDHLLAAAPEPVVPVLGTVHRTDQPGAALRRGSARGGLRDGDRAAGDPPAHHLGARAGRGIIALAGRPRAAAPADRPHGQHAPCRVLHRQALQPRQQPRPARAARAARIRDAAASAARTRAGAARAQPRRDVLGEAAHRSAREMGHPAARGLPAARGRDRRHRRGRRRSARARHRVRGGLARRVHRIPLPAGSA